MTSRSPFELMLRATATAAAMAMLAMPGAATARNTMRVDTTVVRGCSLAALPMMFGTVAFFLPQANARASIFVDCTPNTAFTVSMDNGQNPNGTQRRMIRTGAGVGTYLSYEVYRDAARTQRWGTSGGQVVNGNSAASGKVTLYAYGRTTGLVASGPFQDVVAVTITF